MSLTITPERLKRYKDIALLIIKHSGSDMMKNTDSEAAILEEEYLEKSKNGDPEKFANDLEEMGPTFIKLGQLLSTRPDFLSEKYINALTRLQDKVEPFPFDQVETIVHDELGVRISKAFREFEPSPMAAASLGQVHKAVTREGKTVAVKVQRPEIRKRIVEDLNALSDIAATLDKYTETGKRLRFLDILNEFRKTLIQELDYRLEAQNLIKMGVNLQNFRDIIIPQPVEDYCSSKVLTMDYILGTKVTSLHPAALMEVNGNYLAEELFKAYLDQVLIHGFFHADPHPGNVFITPDHKIALIDLGMVARIDPDTRENLLKLLLYISEGRGVDAAKLGLKMSIVSEDANEGEFTKRVSEFVAATQDITLAQIQIGKVIVELTRIAANTGIRTAPELTMLGKTFLNLDEIGKTLNPSFNPNEVIKRHAEMVVRRLIFKNFSAGFLFSSLLEAKDFLQKLPVRLNSLFESLMDNQLEFKIKAFDDSSLMENLQKIANRITMGLVLAALIIGAALLMRVQSSFTILGYPGLAMLLFLIAAGFGFTLVLNILLRDEWKKKRKPG